MLALVSHRKDPGHAQDLEVVRDRRLRDVEPFGDLSTAELTTRGDLLNHSKPRRIAERSQRLHERPVVQLLDVSRDHDPFNLGTAGHAAT